jgi:Ca2+-transporting ATPase
MSVSSTKLHSESSQQNWHSLKLTKIVSQFETDLQQGLSKREVSNLQDKYGLNVLTKKKILGLLIIFLEQFRNPLIYILLIAAAITGIMQEWIDCCVILAVVLINATIGFVQEAKASAAMEALSRSMQSQATVIRGGEKQQISATELVPGDIILLQSGDKVPADLRLVRSRSLQIDESTLTGESVPIEKDAVEKLDVNEVLADRINMAYSSTLVTFGTGMGIVVATGDKTEIGNISSLIASAEQQSTPLTQKIAHLSHILIKAILVLGILTFIAGFIRGYNLKHMFEATISLMIGMIPEGLPAIVTVALAIGVSRMAQQNAIIRKLPAVETLGSVTVICSDKTGTLTQNEMTVQEVFIEDKTFHVWGVGYAPNGKFTQEYNPDDSINPESNDALMECLKAGLLCNDSSLVEEDGKNLKVEGDPTEAALLTVAAKAGIVRKQIENLFPRIDSIPFESQYQYMATLHDIENSQNRVVYLKGSIEQLLPRCNSVYLENNNLTNLDLEKVYAQAEQMAAKGLRVLAFARLNLPVNTTSIDHESVASGLTFVGLQGMIDPPRTEAIEAVSVCNTAKIEVKMITGDHIGTATAIGEKIGLNNNYGSFGKLMALSGKDIEALSQEELIAAVDTVSVFARVTPKQKLRIVEALQTQGHVVAMTGDGSNDAPALGQANVGVAMGITGTEVAKETADMVLTDDNFATIKAAVEQGRSVYDNITKAIVWTLPTNFGEGLIIVIATFFGLALPITPLHILWINTVTAVLLGSTLIFEPKEPGLMQRPPRPPRMPLLTKAIIRRIFFAGCLLAAMVFIAYNYALQQGQSVMVAQTVAVNALVGGEISMLLGWRSLKYSIFELGVFTNLWLWGGIGLAILVQLLFTYTPLMNFIFETEAIPFAFWLRILSGMVVLYSILEVDKWLQYYRRQSKS